MHHPLQRKWKFVRPVNFQLHLYSTLTDFRCGVTKREVGVSPSTCRGELAWFGWQTNLKKIAGQDMSLARKLSRLHVSGTVHELTAVWNMSQQCGNMSQAIYRSQPQDRLLPASMVLPIWSTGWSRCCNTQRCSSFLL